MKAGRIGLVLGLAFTMVLALSQVPAGATEALAPGAVYDISFDGYCDGMQLNIPSVGLGTSDTVDGHHTGCITGGLAGTVSGSPRSAHISTTYGGLVVPHLHYLVNSNQTWAVYGQSGDLITFVNSGTWSFGPPTADGRASSSVRSRSLASTAAPGAVYDISFDGYCDGMQLNIPSVGLGTSDTVDGHHTGCITGGFGGTVSAGPRAAHITTDYGDLIPSLLHFRVNANQTWVIYGISGDLITFVNSGTWSFGPPTGAGPASAG